MNCADDVEEAKNSSDEEHTEKDEGAEGFETKDHLNPRDFSYTEHYKQVAADTVVSSHRQPASGRPSSSGVSSDEPLTKDH